MIYIMLKRSDSLIRNHFLALESVHHCILKNFQIIKTEKATFLRRATSQQGQGEVVSHTIFMK